MKTTIEVSGRHIHLTTEDFFELFNQRALTVNHYLESDHKQFSAKETVEIVGPKNHFVKVRVVGPFRDYTQFELSKTDAYVLDIDAPLKLSGTGSGATVRVIGKKGEITKNIAIIAKRHLHISTKIADKNRLRQNDIVKVQIAGNRGLIFDNVVVRVDEVFNNHLHLDTDEGNACGIEKRGIGIIV